MSEKNRFSLFGFRVGKKETEKKEDTNASFTPPAADDGSLTISSSAFMGTSIDQDGSVKSEVELISRYREMSVQPEIEAAIEDVVNESIVQDDEGNNVHIVLDDLKQSDKIKDAIREEFNIILRLLNFNNMGSDVFRRFYIDGRLFYHVIIDVNNPQRGILELRYIDPRKIKKVREVKKKKDETTGVEMILDVNEFYLYNDKVSASQAALTGVKIAPDSIINVNSGLMDTRRSMVLSYLHKAIKPLNQLRMIEDASVINKLARAPQRRIFYIDVGSLPKAKAEQYVRDIMTKYKNKVNYNPVTGEVQDSRTFMTMLEDYWLPRRCLSLDTKIKLLDGRDVELSDLIAEYDEGKENWVYSVSPEGEMVPGKISWAGITRRDAEVVKVTIDSGEEIICTPDHKFVLRDGSLCEAQYLEAETSLMPLYTREHNISNKCNGKYEQFFNNKTNRWNFTHRYISEFANGEQRGDIVVHHVDFDRYNNNPTNLVLMDKKEHFDLHSRLGTNSWKNGNVEEHKLNLSISGKKFFETEAGLIRRQEISEFNKSSESVINGLIKGRERIKELREFDKQNLSEEEYREKWVNAAPLLARNEKTRIKEDSFDINIIKDIIDQHFYPKITVKEILQKIQETYPEFKYKTLAKFLPYHGYQNMYALLKDMFGDNFKRGTNPKYTNHKVVSVEFLDYKIDTGTLTIDENHEFHDYHNFALSCGIYVKNSDGKSTEIRTLESADTFTDMSMVEYFEKKLYKSLNVPVTRLDPQQAFSIGRTAEITRDELKFAKFIDKLRNKFAELFDQALRVQLVLKGICTEEEWNEFKENVYFDFIKDNNFVELKEAELMQERLGLLATVDPYVGKYFSLEWVRKKVLRLDDEEIKEMEQQIEKEKDKNFKDQQEQILMQTQLQQYQMQLNPQAAEQGQETPQAGQPVNPMNPSNQ
jgi:hypothetical protein